MIRLWIHIQPNFKDIRVFTYVLYTYEEINPHTFLKFKILVKKFIYVRISIHLYESKDMTKKKKSLFNFIYIPITEWM